MKLIEVKIKLSGKDNILSDVLPYRLSFEGYDGFVENQDGFSAFINLDLYNREALSNILLEYNLQDCFTETLLPDKNWNEEWEKNFEPVIIADKVFIRAPFHSPNPGFPIEIIIEPKMSFGTGHHATTSLMIEQMLLLDFQEKRILDAGCGTGILSIFAEKVGADSVTAVDIDEWSYNNTIENIEKNHCNNIRTFLADITATSSSTQINGQFHGILANINLNILKASLGVYAALCIRDGFLLASGILSTDIQALKEDAEQAGFVYENSKSLNNWAVIRFRKK